MKLSMSFVIKDEVLLYNTIQNKASNSVKKGFDSELVYNEKFLKTKIHIMKVKSIQIFIM